jgi:hypothetical protein
MAMRRSILMAIAVPVALAAVAVTTAAQPGAGQGKEDGHAAMSAAEAAALAAQNAAYGSAAEETVIEAEAFMAAYADDLRRGHRAAIAARYDHRGVYVMGRGRKILSSRAETAAYYAGPGWQPPAAFEWQGLEYEPIGEYAVAVVGQFLWTPAAGAAPLTYSYTALLVRQDGALRIRIEDENPAPAAAGN